MWRPARDNPGLTTSLFAAAVLRLTAAACNFGWFTRDDYQLGIEQAYAWLHQPDASFSADIRSPVLSFCSTLLMAAGEALGLTDRADLVRFMYAGWGLFSLLAIPAVYRVAKRTFGAAPAAIAAWLMAAYAIMPAISVRAMIEVVAIVPLAWGFDWVDRARHERGFANAFRGALALGFAALVRFQLGLLFIPAAWVLRRQGRRAWAGLGSGACVALMLQCLCDVALGRPPLGTPWAYIKFNLRFADTFGTSPWYTYLLQFLLFTLPPLTFAFAQPLVAAVKKHAWAGAALVVFVGVHSLVGHKEDRFMFSMLPVFFVLLAAALHAAWRGKAWQRTCVLLFIAINTVALAVATLSDTHRSVSAPLLWLGRHAPGALVASVGFLSLPDYYLGDVSGLRMFSSMEEFVPRAGEQAWDYVWLRGPDLDAQAAELSKVTRHRCTEVTRFYGDLADRILVRVNRHNARRGPTALVRCAAADAGGVSAG